MWSEAMHGSDPTRRRAACRSSRSLPHDEPDHCGDRRQKHDLEMNAEARNRRNGSQRKERLIENCVGGRRDGTRTDDAEELGSRANDKSGEPATTAARMRTKNWPKSDPVPSGRRRPGVPASAIADERVVANPASTITPSMERPGAETAAGSPPPRRLRDRSTSGPGRASKRAEAADRGTTRR